MVRRTGGVRVLVLVAVAFAALFAFAGSASAAQRNPECLSCHQSMTDWSVLDVDRSTACAKCHTPGLVGTHPRHNAGGNCGAVCHLPEGWGDSLRYAIPTYVGAEGSFATPSSKDASSGILHVIHASPRWMGSLNTPSEKCASCHGVAACSACHDETDIPLRHLEHSASGNASYTAQAPWVGDMAHGVMGGDLTQETVFEVENQCATVGCHDVAGSAAGAAVQRESHSHAPVAASPVTDIVTYAPRTWSALSSTNYSLQRAHWANAAGYTLTTSFTAEVVEVITDVDPYRGMAQVWIDDVLRATIDCYAPTTGYQRVVYRSPKLSAGGHKIEIRALGTKNPLARGTYVVVDGFRAYSTVRDSIAPECESCHADKTAQHGFTFPHVVTGASFTAGNYSGYSCATCHSATMTDEHRRESSKTNDSICNGCHTVYAPYTDPAASVPPFDYSCTWNGVSGAPGCHKVANSQDPHNFVDGDHVPANEASEAKCRGCHAGNLDVIHANSIVTNAFEPNCLSCHGLDAYPTTDSCTAGCHEASAVDSMETHPYNSPKHTGSGLDAGVANTGGLNCDTCHVASMELYPEHSRSSSELMGGGDIVCSTCHDQAYLPRPWSDTCVECHAAGKAPVPHNAFDSKHDFSVYAAANLTNCGGATCHDVANADLIHGGSPADGVVSSCQSCHTPTSGVPTKKLCSDCHTNHSMTVAHNASSYADGVACARCHDGFSNVSTAHAACSTCHNPATGQLVDYLNANYTASCTDCHTAAVLGANYKPADPAHYVGSELVHTASGAQAASTYDYDGIGAAYSGVRCDACHSMEMKPEHIAKSYTNFVGVPGAYPDKCIACHEQKVDNFAGAWNDTCDVCHAAKHTGTTAAHNASTTMVTGTSNTALVSCGQVGCHNVANIAAIHNNSVTGNATVTTCTNTCHSASPVQAIRDCGVDGCHPGGAHGSAVHDLASNAECAGCHESTNVQSTHVDCDQCHDNPSWVGITADPTTAECIDCHNVGEVYGKDYAPSVTNHYAGTEANHASVSNGTYNTYQCSQCHKMDMKDEHAKASVAFPSFDNTSTVIGKCTGCHELKVDAFVGAWDKKCASCHPATHTERTAKHNASVSNAGCGGVGCHAVNDVAVIHNNSITTNSMFPSCVTCHANNSSVPAPIACEAAGCHAGMQHGHSLNLTGSNYNNTAVTGCTNSGVGCHGSQNTSPTPDYAIAQYHPDNGCQSGACHASASQANAAFNNPQTCQNCHGGRGVAPLNFTGAPDVISLTSATTSATGGHYNETSHTIVSVVQTMSVGGAAQTTCVTCHQHTNALGIDGEWYQHQVLQGYGNTTCYDCHSFVTPGDVAGTSRVGNVIQTAVANNTDVDCVDCHNALIMGVNYVMHETTSSPPATATVLSTPGFQCGDTGCHAATGLEIHELHKGDGNIIPTWEVDGVTPYNPATCAAGVCHPNYPTYLPAGSGSCDRRPEPECVDCHDPLLQGWKPDETSCGVNGDCHITSPHSSIGPAHSVTALSQACVDCHETTDLRSNHGYTDTENCSSNNVCHDLEGTEYTYNSQQYTFTLLGKKECKDCHALGKMPNVTRDHAPHDPNHYVGSETTHTATLQTGGFGAIYSTVATEGFDSATWPAAWTRNSTSLVLTNNSAPLYEGTYHAQIYTTSTTRSTNYFERVFDTSNVSSPTVQFNYTTTGFAAPDYARLEYSTDGVNFTQLWNTAVTQTVWTKVGPMAVPRSDTLTLRFSASTNANNSDRFRVDAFVLKPGDAAPVSCFLTCHYDELKPEHFKASAEATRVPGIYPDKCVDCHENRTDAFDVTHEVIDWDRTCDECHGAAQHLGQTVRHDATTVAPQCGGSGCHYIKDVAVIHNNSALGNGWPSDPSQTCTVCHASKLSAPSTLDCSTSGCHEGMVPHTHDLDYDGSVFNATTVTGCVQSGAGCHGNSTATNYATTYHSGVGCLEGGCHLGSTTQDMPEFNNPNTCMNCHGGGTVAYDGATDRIPVAGASPNGHYPAVNHTAAASDRTASLGAGGTASATCSQCHNPTGASGVDGLYPIHQGLTGLGNTSCVDCHNYNIGVITEITGNWTTDTCADCHNVTDMPSYVAHSSAAAPAVTATEYSGGIATPGACAATGCHTGTNLHDLHKNAAGGCAPVGGGCHDYTKQAYKPTLKTCGDGGACHTSDAHDPAAHNVIDSANCTRCHEGAGGAVATSIQSVYTSTGFGNVPAHTCSSCHNAGANLGATNTADCVDCHNAVEAGTHAYTPYDPNHYYTTSHDSSQTTGANWGTTTYGDTLSDFHGTAFNYERGCTTCHTIDLKTEHDKTSVAFGLGGKADKCAACHELKVDNWAARWNGSCSGEANSCHNLSSLHSDWSTKHNASAQTMSAPGSSFALGSTASVATENFGTTTTFPAAWTRSSTTYVTNQTGSARSGAAAQIGVNTTRNEYTFYRTTAFSLASYAGGTVRFWYQVNVSDSADYLICEYSTTNGTSGYTELFRVNADALTWTQSPALTVPGGGNVWIRFRGTFNATGEYGRVDDFEINGASAATYGAALPANSTAAVSCQNNPNGTECHDVSDVANIHSRTANNGCPICHTGTAQNPTNLNCQAAGCHVGVNVDNHNTAWHESAISNTTLFGTGFTATWCLGCHDDSIDNEHTVLAAYNQSPCSMCHRKGSDSAAPVSVTSANTSSTIHADATAGNELCTECHTTVTKSAPHVKRTGDAGTPGTQFADNWSGHKSYDTMYGSRTGGSGSTFNGQTTSITWSLPTATSWLKTGWTTTTMAVRCSDCHGSVTGATGPHGGAMQIKLATGYDNSYSLGTLYLSGTSMSNTTNICAKCHTTTGMGYNNVHSRSDHYGTVADGRCTNCHTPTPHAWKRPRLIGYRTDPAPYRTMEITGITQRSYTPTGWSKSYCGVGGSCGSHSGSPTTPTWP